MSRRNTRNGYLRQAWLVILLALLCGSGLATVQTTLGPRIAENKQNETYSEIPNLVPGADPDDFSKTVKSEVKGRDGKSTVVYQAFGADGEQVGWVLPASGSGFADKIDILIGLNLRLTALTGLFVLDQKETPGLGDGIADPEFRDLFVGKPTDRPLVVVTADPTSDNEIRALTGATISSDSVTSIVNKAVANYKEPILELSEE